MDPAETAAAAATAAATTADPVEPAQAADPVEPPAAPPAVPEKADVPPPAEQTFPWDKDVAERFTDPAQAKSVSEFMREKYAPYTTKVEQERAELREQAALFQQFTEDPDATLLEVVAELYPDSDPDAVRKFFAGIGENVDEPASKETKEAVVASMSDEDKETLEWARQQRKETADKQAMDEYMAEVKPVMEANPDIPESVLHRYISTSGGDFDAAVAAFRADFPTAENAPAAPPTTTGGTPTGPRAPDYGADLDAALSRAWAGLKK